MDDGGWIGKPDVRKILFKHVPDANTQVEYLKSGEADMLDDVPRPVWDSMDADDQIDMHTWWALNVCYIGVNVKHEKTSELEVRRAIQTVIDREALLELYYGYARPSYSLVAQPLAEYDPSFQAIETATDDDRVAAGRA